MQKKIALSLQLNHPKIIPNYHMNKIHENTISFDGKLIVSLITELINHSYQLVYNNIPTRLLIIQLKNGNIHF